jgi:hypothetical protein
MLQQFFGSLLCGREISHNDEVVCVVATASEDEESVVSDRKLSWA